MNPLDPATGPVDTTSSKPVEIVLDGLEGSPGHGDADAAVEQTDVLDTRDRKSRSGKSRATLLGLVALLALGVMVWRVMPSDDTPAGGDTADVGDSGDSATESGEANSAEVPETRDADAENAGSETEDESATSSGGDSSGDDPQVGSDLDAADSGSGLDAPAPGEFPLFDGGDEWVLAVVGGDEVQLVDVLDGSVRSIPLTEVDDEPADDNNFQIFDQRRIERLGDRLVLADQGRVVGVPLDAGASIDFGPAAAFYVDNFGGQERLVLIRQVGDNFNGGSAPEFESQVYDPDGVALGEPFLLPEYPSLFSFDGVMSGLVGTYRVDDDGFERLSTGYVVASGENHVLVNECDDALDCNRALLDLRTGNRTSTADLPEGLPFDGFGSATVSPDGRWVVTGGGFGQLVELSTGETLNLGPEVRLAPPLTFSPDGRFAVAIRLRNFLVLDLETGQSRSVIADDLTQVTERSIATILDPAS